MDLYLIPKQWVKELVYLHIADFVYEFAKVILTS